MLVKSPQLIKLSDIIQVLEGSVSPADCVDNPACCTRSSACVTRDVWTDMKKAIEGVLEAKTLQDLVEQQKRKEQPMYFI
jgi:Rrf2 family protein